MLRRFLFNCTFICSLLFSSIINFPAFAIEEYAIKSTWILNFIKFIEWPEGTGSDPKKICVIGRSEINNYSYMFEEESYGLVSKKDLENIASECRIVFISPSEYSRLDTIFSALKNHPVLTISDMDNFAERGGMIGFVVDDNKIRFVVNNKAVKQAKMKADSSLLEVALRVIDG